MEWLVPVARLLLSAVFIISGLNHFTQREGLVAYARSGNAPAPELTVPLTGLMLLLGGLSLLLGYQVQWGAWLLVLFLIPAAFIMHRFWGLDDAATAANQMAHFLKNLALAGAALLVAYFGPGPYSLAG